jgi:hypothetical protein
MDLKTPRPLERLLAEGADLTRHPVRAQERKGTARDGRAGDLEMKRDASPAV